MSGCYQGVAAKLKRSYRWLLYVHCAAHRLNLIVAEYFRTVKAASNVMKIYKSLHDIIETATKLCSTVGIMPDYEDPLSNTRNDTTTPRELCESLKTTSIPLLLQELERRFSDDNIQRLWMRQNRTISTRSA